MQTDFCKKENWIFWLSNFKEIMLILCIRAIFKGVVNDYKKLLDYKLCKEKMKLKRMKLKRLKANEKFISGNNRINNQFL